jgi:hypothetical protein
MTRLRLSVVLFAAVLLSSCQASDPAAPPMLTPTVTLSRQSVPLGSPVDMTYKFVVANDAKFTSNFHVMVHFGDRDEQLMYTDDHEPPTPTTSWKPGQTIEYTRTFFTPTYPYIGLTTVEVGMFAAGEKLRVPMAGVDTGHRSYKVATLELRPQNESVQTIFKDGFHGFEGAPANGISWHWMKKQGTLALMNPNKDSVFYLEVDDPSPLLTTPQAVTVFVGSTKVDEFSVVPGQPAPVLRKIAMSASTWNRAENVEVKIAVDKTFVPQQLKPAEPDIRELGIRVLHAVVVPK